MNNLKFKETIVETLKKEGYTRNEVEEVLETINNKEFFDFNFFEFDVIKALTKKGIIKISILMDSQTKDIINILKKNNETIKHYIDKINKYIKIKIHENREKNKHKKQAQIDHNEILKLAQEINDSPELYKCLLLDINHLEDLFYKNKVHETFKNWYHSYLNLTKEEIQILKLYLFKKPTFESITKSNHNNYEMITNIFKNLTHYLNKIKYKQILKQNYDEIDDLNLTQAEKNKLKRIGINSISDIIEYTEERVTKYHKIGRGTLENIKKALQIRNIIFLDDPILLSEKLKLKNAGITSKEDLTKRINKPQKTQISDEEKRRNRIKLLILREARLAAAILEIENQIQEEQHKLNYQKHKTS